jgi:Asp-tRNA(Asn)/Glu-tRNA(Gln) amidotransferase B subunit
MLSDILEDFISSGVLRKDQYNELWDLFDTALISKYSISQNNTPNYEEVFVYITTMMLKHNLHNCTESTPLRQALRDLFNENPKEFDLMKSGNPKMTGFFMGRVFKKVGQIYNPKDVQDKMSEMVVEETTTHFWEE